MARMITMAVLVGLCVAPAALAQDSKQDEATIRGQIAALDRGERVPILADNVFWSGAYQKPSVGRDEAPRRKGRGEREPGTDRSVTTVVKLEVSQSRDLAWEYSQSEMTFTFKDGRKTNFTRSILRVWKKDGGQWKMAATFGLPQFTD